MIDHKTIAVEVVAVCNKHKLSSDAAVKCLIYTATKLLAQQLNTTDTAAAEVLSKAALRFRDEIKRVERMFKNKG